jgi:hypothetical protein
MNIATRNNIQLHICQAIHQVNQIGKLYQVDEQDLCQLQSPLFRILELLDHYQTMEQSATQIKREQVQFFMSIG